MSFSLDKERFYILLTELCATDSKSTSQYNFPNYGTRDRVNEVGSRIRLSNDFLNDHANPFACSMGEALFRNHS
ncbi:hypothetical protein VCR1J2_640026 [Vibrio coralliirubri]|nr:hypothetical protein VCR1J2_640026 [Vibrio coralliirubri]CDT98395.1 hypothetical protein VCR8J2_580027 [Vibrio coralliirubri]